MRGSRYNYIITRGAQTYWFNGLSRCGFVLPSEISAKAEALLKDCEAMRENAPTLYDKLVGGGFIVPDNTDELGIVRQINNKEVEKDNYFLIIMPTLNCNFSCWYCIQQHLPSMMSDETIEKVKRHIDFKIKQEGIKALHIEWFGGEPFLYLDKVISPISRYAREACDRAEIPFYNTATTNAFYLTPDKDPLIKELGLTRFQITLDGPRYEHDKVKFQKGCTSAFDHVLLNIDSLLSSVPEAKVILRINYTPENLTSEIVSQVSQLISAENRKRVHVCPKKVWQAKNQTGTYKTAQDILHLFEREGFTAAPSDLIFDFVPCYTARRNFATINFNGHAVKCTASDDIYTDNPLGWLEDEGRLIWRDGIEEAYLERGFENPVCLACRYLPLCMGRCPRDTVNGVTNCKLAGSGVEMEEAIVEYVKRFTI